MSQATAGAPVARRPEREAIPGLRVAIDARQLWELGIGTYVRNLLGGLARARDAAAELDLTLLLPPGPWPDVWVDAVAAAAGFPGAQGLPRAREIPVGRPAPRAPEAAMRPPRALTSRAGKHSLLQQIAVPMQVAGRGLHLVHAPHYICALGVPCPLVVTVHDLIHLLFPEFLTPGRRRVARVLLAMAVRRARRVIADSERTAADLAQFFPHERNKLRVIHPGLAAGFATPPTPTAVEEFRRSQGLPERYVLAVGALRPHKNLSLLARAYAASALPPGVGLVLAGLAPPRFSSLPARLAAEAGPGARILGHVPDPDLPLLYAGATAVAVPSLYEGFGFAAAEAMATGVPVLAAQAGSLPEVIGEAGILLPAGDAGAWRAALEWITSDGRMREELSARGRERAKAFSLERLGRETLAVYREVAFGEAFDKDRLQRR